MIWGGGYHVKGCIFVITNRQLFNSQISRIVYKFVMFTCIIYILNETVAGKLPVVRVARAAGQFAKPRSSPTEIVNGESIPSFKVTWGIKWFFLWQLLGLAARLCVCMCVWCVCCVVVCSFVGFCLCGCCPPALACSLVFVFVLFVTCVCDVCLRFCCFEAVMLWGPGGVFQ